MKRFSLFILILGLLLLSACSTSDSSEADMTSNSADTVSEKFEDSSQTELKNTLGSTDPEKTDSETPDVSDRNGNGEGSKSSASSEVPSESAPTSQQADGGQSEVNSQVPAASSEPKQNESVAPSEAPKKTERVPSTVTQQPLPKSETPKKTVEQLPKPEKPKTIYDYVFDANAIRSDLIALGQSMGLTHITEDDGIPCTPDTCSWAAPVTASESFQGDNLKRALKDYVTSMPSMIASYGGPQLTSFTIYVQDNGGGSYTFYFLY